MFYESVLQPSILYLQIGGMFDPAAAAVAT